MTQEKRHLETRESGFKHMLVHYGGLNENGPHSLMYLDTGLQLVELFEKDKGGVMLLEEVCHWRLALNSQKTFHSQCVSLCLLLEDQDVSSWLFLLPLLYHYGL